MIAEVLFYIDFLSLSKLAERVKIEAGFPFRGVAIKGVIMDILLAIVSIMAGALLVPGRWWGNRQRGARPKHWPWMEEDYIYCVWGLLMFLVILPFLMEVSWWQVLIALGLLIGAEYAHYTPAWGKWFPHADKDTSWEKEGILGEYVIDPMTTLILGYYMPSDLKKEKARIIKYKTLAFALRFGLCALPKYAVIAYFTVPWAIIWVLPMFTAGLIYKRNFAEFAGEMRTVHAELETGLMVGVVDATLTLALMAVFLL